MTRSSHSLLPQHEALIKDSAISPQVVEARGYFSATEKSELEQLGFRPYQQRVPALVVPIWDVHGQAAFHQIRPDQPRVTDGGKELKYETPAGVRLVVDVPPSVRSQLGDPEVPLWITEGSRKADAAVSAGLCCVGLTGVWGWRGTNEQGGKTALGCWESIALNERVVYIAFDSDVMTKEPVELALMRVRKFLKGRGAKVKLVYLPHPEDGGKVGLDDFLAAGGTIDELILSAKTRPEPSNERKQESQAQRVLEVVSETDVELFHDPEPTPYISFTVRDHRENHVIGSRAVRQWLSFQYYKEHGTAPNPESIRTAILTMEGRARFDGEEHPVLLRVGHDRGAVVLDLCNPDWSVARADAAGWNVLRTSPVRFRRAGGMMPLPLPESGGDLAELRRFVNVASEDDFALVVGWLVASLRPVGPYPILILLGEQGSAKSTCSRVLRRLMDPNKAPLRGRPREARDLAIAANNGWCIALDNLSGLSDWLSDALCQLATGGGFATRKLYTDGEEAIFDAQRPILLNGIDDVATRPDLLDRALVLTLPRLREVREEQSFWSEFEKAQPRLLGALLDAVSMALRRESEVEVPVSVRMMDAARWVTAAEPALPWSTGTFIRAYAANLSDANSLALEASALATELRRFMEGLEEWKGHFKDLLVELESRASDGVRRLKSWPRTPRGLSGELRRLAPNLRAIGLDLEFPGKRGRGKDRRAWLLIRKALQQPAPRAPSAPEHEPEPDPVGYGGGESADSGAGADLDASNGPQADVPEDARDRCEGADGVGGAGRERLSQEEHENPEDGSEWGEV